jgi:O-antigen/teichoic acid export membrane protein
MSRRAGVARIASSMIASLLLQARNLIISLVVFRVFDDPRLVWGTVNNVLVVVTVLALPAKFGLEFTGVQYVSKYREDRPDVAADALRKTAWLRGGLAVLAALPMLVAPGVVGALVGMTDVPELVQLGGLLLFTTSWYEFTSLLLSGTDNFRGMARARLIYTVVNVLGIGMAAWRARSGVGDGAADIVGAQVAGGALAMAYGSFVLWRELRGLDQRAPTVSVDARDDAPTGRAMWRALIAYSLPMLVVNGSGQLFSYLGRIVLPMLADRAVLGSYALAESAIAAAVFGTYAFRNVARTRLPNQLRTAPDEAKRTLLATYRASLMVGGLISAGAIATAPALFQVVYGPDAAEAASMMPWWAPYVMLSAHGSFSATALAAADRQKVYSALMLGCGLLGLAFNVLLIPAWGGFGAIAGGTLSFVPLAAIAWHLVVGTYGLDGRAVAVASIPTGLKILGMTAVTTAVGWLIAAPTWPAAVGAGVAQVAVFGGMMWATGELRALRAAM